MNQRELQYHSPALQGGSDLQEHHCDAQRPGSRQADSSGHEETRSAPLRMAAQRIPRHAGHRPSFCSVPAARALSSPTASASLTTCCHDTGMDSTPQQRSSLNEANHPPASLALARTFPLGYDNGGTEFFSPGAEKLRDPSLKFLLEPSLSNTKTLESAWSHCCRRQQVCSGLS